MQDYDFHDPSDELVGVPRETPATQPALVDSRGLRTATRYYRRLLLHQLINLVHQVQLIYNTAYRDPDRDRIRLRTTRYAEPPPEDQITRISQNITDTADLPRALRRERNYRRLHPLPTTDPH